MEPVDQGFGPVLTPLLGQATGRRDHLRHKLRFIQWRKIDPLRVALADELAGDARLANSTGSNECQQPRASKLRREGRQQLVAPVQHARVRRHEMWVLWHHREMNDVWYECFQQGVYHFQHSCVLTVRAPHSA